MVLIGVDPHKASHTAVVIDGNEQQLGMVQVRADRRQLERLLTWAAPFDDRTWAVESAGGLGYLLSQQLVAAGETVVDVPATLAARVRLLGSGRGSKNDPNDAFSTAIAALRHPGLRSVQREDHSAVLRVLADRHTDLSALRTQAVCRFHAALSSLIPGSAIPRKLSAKRAAELLRRARPTTAIGAERRRLAVELLADIRRLDRERAAQKKRIAAAVAAASTTVTDVYGVGDVVAALVIGHTGDVSRFASKDHFASYNGTAPIEASSGPKARHRLNPRGNRQLNHAIHMAAVTQIRNDTPGRAYYERKQAEGKSKKEAVRALKRRVSDAVYRQLVLDAKQR
jgi:transposase